ncbi:MAG: thermonuclease family protein [Ruminococcaceae bacterium]|nr:thermonuclease family protein [Oscillospiraceae bacterium]
MRALNRWLCVLSVLVMVLGCMAGCDQNPSSGEQGTEAPAQNIDFAAEVKLDMESNTAKVKVNSIHAFIDGDTTHFEVPTSVAENGILKARYLAINTPESTGKIEEYGKTAAAFTKEKLSGASSIYIESDDANWNLDSTGGRHLVWVWYRNSEDEEYRNLNIEILQNGLAIASNSAQNRYGEKATAAIAQAKAQKLNVYSGKKDPNFYYGEAVELTLKELRTNIEAYNGVKVAFNGVITANEGQAVYIEDYDAETNMYYGMYIYYGYGLSGEGLDILSVGNEARIVGTVQYYEVGGTYQVSGLTYRQMKPNDPGNIQKLSDGHSPAYFPTEADTFINGKVEIEREDEIVAMDYAQLAQSTSIEMKNLVVKSIYTTVSDTNSNGAMTLTCEVNGVTVDVRTVVLYDENGALVTEEYFAGKTIDVKGLVDYFSGSYQIKVLSLANITIHE